MQTPSSILKGNIQSIVVCVHGIPTSFHFSRWTFHSSLKHHGMEASQKLGRVWWSILPLTFIYLIKNLIINQVLFGTHHVKESIKFGTLFQTFLSFLTSKKLCLLILSEYLHLHSDLSLISNTIPHALFIVTSLLLPSFGDLHGIIRNICLAF